MTGQATAVLVGCGDISSVHLEAISRLEAVRLVGVCDVDERVARATATAHGVLAFQDHRQMLAALRPDVAHICTPHDQHASAAVDCIAAGTHVIVEKPLAHTLSEASRVVEAAAAYPAVKVAVCYQNRYNRTSQAAREAILSGGLGTVRGAQATVAWHRGPDYYRHRPWRGQRSRSGGGVLINQAIHTVDLLTWFLGDLTAVGSRIGTHALADLIDVEDTAHLVMDHVSGARSVLFATVANTRDAPVSIEIDADAGHLTLRGHLTVVRADGGTEVVEERAARGVGRAYWGASHELLIADFYARLAEPQPFWIGPEQAMASLSVLDQVYREAFTGG